MSDEKALVAVFTPALAIALAVAEKEKGTSLTQAEAEAIRDKSPCIMMRVDDAQRMTQARGYVDVNPENCWADWHRLRPQITGGFLPKIVLCIPGSDDLRRSCEPILKAAKVEYEFQPRDPRIVRAFEASSMSWPSLSPEDIAHLASHTTVLYALSKNFSPAAAADTGVAFLKLGRQLLDAGGIAIKCESSGLAHSAERWARFGETIDGDPGDRWAALFNAYVLRPISSENDLYTCGMHLLGAPDLIISTSALATANHADDTIAAAIRLFRALGVYLVSECPVGHFASGHTFRMDANSPRYRVGWEPCEGYAEDDFFFNPFGRWRLTAI